MNQDMWRDFVTAIGRDDLLADARCRDATTRWEHRDALNDIVTAWTRTRTKHEVMAELGKAGVPCGAVLDTGEVLDDPHLNAVGFWQEVDHPTEGRLRMTRFPVTFSKTPADVRRLHPRLGEHTAEILREAGLGDA